MAETAIPSHLEPSKLGTKQYWDALYATELTNHAYNPEDEGTVWFDDSDAEAKLVEFLERHVEDEDGDSPLDLNKGTTTFLDLGCGNGSLLFAVRDAGWEGRLLGVDYSEASVALAVKVGAARRRREEEEEEEEEQGEEDGQGQNGVENGAANGDASSGETKAAGSKPHFLTTGNGNAHNSAITAAAPGSKTVDFMVWDVLAGPISAVALDRQRRQQQQQQDQGAAEAQARPAGWDVVLDKGTFDAVSLSDLRDADGRRVCEGYRGRVLRLLRPGGVFLVTSCNWTEAELKGWFEGPSGGPGTGEEGREEEEGYGKLRLVDRVEYRSFSFGGVKGQTISTACFMKV